MHTHNPTLVSVSIAIAMLASYVALDLANSLSLAKGRARTAWLMGGSTAMGVGIWSMHFIGMLAFKLPNTVIAYDLPLLVLSVGVAIAASALALFTVSREKISTRTYLMSALFMGSAIAGMHYIGIASMRMPAIYKWNYTWVGASILIALSASLVALYLAVRFRNDNSNRGFWSRTGGGVVMGIAIAGMHYTGMGAMSFFRSDAKLLEANDLIATEGLAAAVIGTTLLILFIALAGSVLDRAFARRLAVTEQIAGILESISDAFYSVNRNWEFIYVNSVAREAFKPFLPENAAYLGETLWKVIPDLQGTIFEDHIRKTMDSGQVSHFEFYFETVKQWFDIHVYPSNEGLSIYFQDITQRKDDEKELRKAISSRDEFLSVASHELKTPLTALKLQS